MKNLKKAYRLYCTYVSSYEEMKKNTIELARLMEIKVSDNALNPRNAAVLHRNNFWGKLKKRAAERLRLLTKDALQESGELYIGQELNSGEDLQTVVKIRDNGVTFENSLGRKNPSMNILYMAFNFEKLPGDDADGDEFWRTFKPCKNFDEFWRKYRINTTNKV